MKICFLFPPRSGIAKKLFVSLLTALSLAALFAAAFCFVRPVRLRVISSSMEPTLWGPHMRLSCPNCGSPFFVTVDGPDPDLKTRDLRFCSCPRCGCTEVPAATGLSYRGDFVFFSRFRPRETERWDLAVYRRADGSFAVKRVVGLPGETIGLRRGTVLINGEPVPKPDQSWSNPDLELTWEEVPDRILFFNTLPRPVFDSEPEPPQRQPAPVTNLLRRYPSLENPAHTDFVNDYRITFPAFLLDGSSLIVNQGDRAWLLEKEEDHFLLRRVSLPAEEPERIFSLTAGDFGAAERFLVPRTDSGPVFTLSCTDGFLTLSAEGEILISVPNPPVSEVNLPVTCPFLFLTEDADLFRLPSEKIRFRRDIGYGNLPPRRLADDEYFLLGDNPAVSDDSRFQAGPILRRDLRKVIRTGTGPGARQKE
ncbi:MAG: hypothetical protein IJG60_09430 [Thermoguttaceae bacterium]|nr:hypothetical protein [Thermoguttaceae bacterium]